MTVDQKGKVVKFKRINLKQSVLSKNWLYYSENLMNKNSFNKIYFIGLIFLFQGKAFPGEEKLGDSPDGSRHPAVHKIKLMDHDSSIIHLYNQPLLPFPQK